MSDYLKRIGTGYFLVSTNFARCSLLTPTQKAILLCLLSHADNDTLAAFPSIKTICVETKTSINTVRRTLNELVDLKYLIKKERRRSDGSQTSNEYIVFDFPSVWKAEEEEKDEAILEFKRELMIRELEKSGYLEKAGYVKIAKEPCSAPTTVAEQSPHSSETDNNTEIIKNQVPKLHERNLSIEDIIIKYDLDVLKINLESKTEHLVMLDRVTKILYDLLNTSKATIRVEQEDKPAEEVKEILLKLDMYEIWHLIDTYCSSRTTIKGTGKAYITTMLYNAKESYENWRVESQKINSMKE